MVSCPLLFPPVNTGPPAAGRRQFSPAVGTAFSPPKTQPPGAFLYLSLKSYKVETLQIYNFITLRLRSVLKKCIFAMRIISSVCGTDAA